MMPLNHILRKCMSETNLLNRKKEINPLMKMDDIKLFSKKEKDLGTLIQAVRIYSQDIAMEFAIEKCPKLIMKSGKRHMMEETKLAN